MKMERDAERAMLGIVVLPKIQEAKECLRAKKTEEMWEIICRDILGLLLPYRESEMEKYNNAPDNLKEAHNVKRMRRDAELYGSAVNLLWDEKENVPRPVDEETLFMVERIVRAIIGRR